MTTESDFLQVATDAYKSDNTRPAKADIEQSMADLKTQATGIVEYDTSTTPPDADATIQELLGWVNTHGYQGLTDAQISSVIDYRAAVKAQGIQLQQLAEQMREQHEEASRQAQQIAQQMQEALNRALQLHPAFEVVTDDEPTQA